MWDQYDFKGLELFLALNFMNLKETKKNFIPEIKKELKKSKLEVLTNENDFLVKNLKKAGWFTRAENNLCKYQIFELLFKDKTNSICSTKSSLV